MTPATITNLEERLPGQKGAPTPLRFGPLTILEAPLLEQAHIEVLEMVTARDEPLTKGQISRLTGLPAAEVQAVTKILCEMRLLRRLNTIIESYVGAVSTST